MVLNVKAVLVNGRNQVKQVIEGLEGMVWLNFIANHSWDKSKLWVFDTNDKLLYTSEKDINGIPHKVKDTENLTFSDCFTQG